MSTDTQPALSVRADCAALPEVQAYIDQALEDAGFPSPVLLRAALAAEEVFVNICRYAGVDTVRLDIATEAGAAHVTFSDEGPAFNPLLQPEPDITLGADDREPGGLGIHMVRSLADDVAYERTSGRNTLRLTFQRKE